MFVPIKDHNPLRVIPFEFVNVALIASCALVFLVYQSGLVLMPGEAQFAFALIPAAYFDAVSLPVDFIAVPGDLTLVTYIFMHGGWLHLLSNMAFLWVFGDNVEDAMGHLAYLAFFLLCGAAAGALHAYMEPASQVPLVGASGAIAGVIAAYLLLHPRVKLWVLVMWRLPLYIPAYLALGVWIALQVISLAVARPEDEVAWWAHVGGLVAGFALTPLLKRREVPLFDRGVAH
jgi:membrane associated rhomboid family serine protease